MADATITDVHISGPLSNISVAYRNTSYISDQILPVIKVTKEDGKYFKYGLENMILPETYRADGAEAKESRYSVTNASYSLQEHALRDIVTDRMKANADAPLQPYVDAVNFLTDLILLRREKDVADYLFNTTTFSGYTAAVGTVWNTYATSAPIEDINTAKSNIAANSGKEANVVVMGRKVWDELIDHPDILDRIKYTQKGVVTKDLIAQLFGVEKVLVGNSIFNDTAEGQSDNLGYVWGKFVLVAYVTPGPSIRSPSLGYLLTGIKGGQTAQVKRWRDEARDGDVVEAAMMFDPVIVSAQSGYLWSSVVT